jgi:hypothetical protein
MQVSSAERLNDVIKTLRHLKREVLEGMPERDDVGELIEDTATEIGSIIEED